MSLKTYQQIQNSAESASQTEYRLFGQVTRAMIEAKDLEKTDPRRHAAIGWNRQLWSVLSTDCAAEGNGLPDQLRAGIISLSIFVAKHSSVVARGEDSMETLIDINRAIMEGLALQAGARQPAPQEPQPTGYGAPPVTPGKPIAV